MTAAPNGSARPAGTLAEVIEAEFDRFFSALTARATVQSTQEERPASRRPPSAQEICDHVAGIIEHEGLGAVTMRRVAAELKISTRTLYKRFDNRHDMIGAAVELRANLHP